MKIEYQETNHYYDYDKKEIRSDSVEDFVYDEVLRTGGCDRDERVILEKQAEQVCKMAGRLLNVLLEKNLLNAEEFHDIVGTYYGYRREGKIVKD